MNRSWPDPITLVARLNRMAEEDVEREMEPDLAERVYRGIEGVHGARHGRSRPRLRAGTRTAAVALAALGAAALVLAWPFAAERPSGILERALAAVGEGPVVHVVFREEWGGELVDLRTGERRPVHAEREVWYDPARGVQQISRLGGVVQWELRYRREELARHEDRSYQLLAEGYHRSLETGTARVVEEGTVDRMPVYWIRVDEQWLPVAADGKDHEWAHDVAVSKETYAPVATRQTRDGRPGPRGTGARILRLERLPAGSGNFAQPAHRPTSRAFRERSEEIPLEQAAAVLGRPALWLGREHAGLPLRRVERVTTTMLQTRETRVPDPQARRIAACLDARPEGRWTEECRRLVRGAYGRRGSVVYRIERGKQAETWNTVRLLYARGRDASALTGDATAYSREPHVVLQMSRSPLRLRLPGAPRGYTPPQGSLYLSSAGSGLLSIDGLHVAIQAPTEADVVAAARALRPL